MLIRISSQRYLLPDFNQFNFTQFITRYNYLSIFPQFYCGNLLSEFSESLKRLDFIGSVIEIIVALFLFWVLLEFPNIDS